MLTSTPSSHALPPGASAPHPRAGHEGIRLTSPILKLNVGCGRDVRPDHINLDFVDLPGVDVRHDLDQIPWPLGDNTFDTIICHHVLEHVKDFHAVIMELHRIARPGATLEVLGPYFFSTKFAGDPSHRIPFCYRTFDNYTAPRRVTSYNRWRLNYATNFGAGFLFKTLEKRYIFDRSPLLRWIGVFHNLAPMFYERFCPAFLPPMEVYFKLQVIKDSAKTGG